MEEWKRKKSLSGNLDKVGLGQYKNKDEVAYVKNSFPVRICTGKTFIWNNMKRSPACLHCMQGKYLSAWL